MEGNVAATPLPMSGPRITPRPPKPTAWLIRQPPLLGSTRHSKWKVVAGSGQAARRNERPGSMPSTAIRWCRPARVCMTPLAPTRKGPSSSTELTSGFQPPQLAGSDQMAQTRSGGAATSNQ